MSNNKLTKFIKDTEEMQKNLKSLRNVLSKDELEFDFVDLDFYNIAAVKEIGEEAKDEIIATIRILGTSTNDVLKGSVLFEEATIFETFSKNPKILVETLYSFFEKFCYLHKSYMDICNKNISKEKITEVDIVDLESASFELDSQMLGSFLQPDGWEDNK